MSAKKFKDIEDSNMFWTWLEFSGFYKTPFLVAVAVFAALAVYLFRPAITLDERLVIILLMAITLTRRIDQLWIRLYIRAV